ncbi:DUF2489 domain-containing protein [Motilimonas sp. 1_MG-2023]|uniref:DUF2489 domain-containing protein n=1 Tax=Motilimonas sp. 1_MG-2023 TaxID=3062672 RepID=UPI0026E4217D|nr:DUF2489 domain-containing protein [Motilimonas sp. 1_MG-2023]MDO6526150.1 DUF2489 domain-containing protein [Motilimonas sp. 1_MG-2023]
MLWWILAGIGLIVIIGLSAYAGILLRKVKDQQLALAKAVEKRNNTLMDSITLIAKAMVQGQCNLSEGAIRLTVLLGELKLAKPIDFDQQYPALNKLYQVVKDMPTHEVRKERSKKEIRQLDEKREKAEQRLEQEIMAEMQQLQEWQLS